MIDNLVNFAYEYPHLYTLPVYAIALFDIIMFIGWFFCTDYHDYVAKKLNVNVLIVFYFYSILLIAACIFKILSDGFQNDFMVFVNSLLWLLVLVYSTIYTLLNGREFFKKKRGKL